MIGYETIKIAYKIKIH